ncbi:transmembrane glycoprotein NMB [Ambystoma mexicanum]|uniref:transmembrane glycoprotein NMB n=1 Tax=Ambystoma mexicanum TaxID=8296 RepID=UPI0037E9A436
MSRTWAVAVLLLPGLLLGAQAAKRFRDVMHHQRTSSAPSGWIQDWSPDSNSWDEKRYPAWGDEDSRWNNCWKGGKVVALVTSDSPALVGSNVTFAVNLQYPRCQKEDENGDIVYDQSVQCRNESSSSLSAGEFVYNWTQWLDYCDSGNCFNGSASNFPDGRPFPPHHDWRRKNFIYVFHTLGQYFQLIGGSSAILSINTTNITLGTQLMEVSVYRRGRGHHTPVTKASGAYVVTDEIPFFVNISQKNDRNTTDQIFIKDSPISFAVKIHDPSHYLSTSVISYDWSFGDGSGAFVSNNPLTSHNYTREGNFSLNLTIKAAIPGPCRPVIPTTKSPTTTLPIPTTILPTNSTNATDADDFLDTVNATTELFTTTVATTAIPTTAAVECVIHRYGYYTSKITIVEGIVEMSILQMTSVQVSAAQVDAIFDFVVTCQGSIPKNACTIISDSACMVPQDMVCDTVEATTDECLLTLRRSFSEPGTYCVNISLSDDASLALASTMLAVQGAPVNARTVEGVLLSVGFLVVLAAVITVLLYKRYKQYKPIDGGEEKPSDGGRVYFSNMKAVFVLRNNEKRPLLKGKAGVV